MSSNVESPSRDFGERSQMTNWILDSGVTCNMTPEIWDFIPVSFVEIDKYIDVVDINFVTLKQTGEVQIKYVTIMAKPSLLHYITYYVHHTYEITGTQKSLKLVHTGQQK